MGRPYPNLVFYLSLESDDVQTEFLVRFAADLDAITGSHTAFLPLVDRFVTGGTDITSPGTQPTMSDIAVRFRREAEDRWIFDTRMATAAARQWGIGVAQLPCWVFVDTISDRPIEVVSVSDPRLAFELLRKACDGYENALVESGQSHALASVTTCSKRAAQTRAELDTARSKLERVRTADLEERLATHRDWVAARAVFRTDLAEAQSEHEGLAAAVSLERRAHELGERFGVDIRDRRSETGRLHHRDLEPHLTKQFKRVFTPLGPAIAWEEARKRHRNADDEQAAAWASLVVAVASLPPLATFYEKEVAVHTAELRRFSRRRILREAGEDVRLILEAFGSLPT